MSHLVIAPVLAPLLAGILLLFLRRRDIGLARTVSLVSVCIQIALALMLTRAVSEGDILVYRLGNWPAPFGIVLVADRLAAWMLLVAGLLALPALYHAIHGRPARRDLGGDLASDLDGRHFHVLFQLQLFGLAGAFLTGDLFNLFVFFEVLLIASYGLLLHGGGRARTRAGLHFVVLNLAGSTLFLFAVGTLFGVLGTLNMADLAVRVSAAPPENAALVRAAGLLLFGVFALKAALIPLHLWLPAAYAETGAAVAALFAIMTKVGAYGILRVYTLAFGPQAGAGADLVRPWLLPLALATLALGMIGVMGSDRLRRQVAYLVIASIGTLLIGVGLGSAPGIAAGLYYLPASTFAAGAFFLLADQIAGQRGALADRLEPGPVMGRHWPLGGLFFVLAVLTVGLPPLSGFVGKFLILRAALDHQAGHWVLGIVLASGLLGLMALARSGSLVFYRATETGPDPQPSVLPPGARSLAPIAALLSLTLAMTVWAGPLSDYAKAMAEQLLHPTLYIQAVLGPGSGVRP
jgi:multicomponent K+:H+ antiporter subunit D